MTERKAWTENERLIALHLYQQIPFGSLHKGNPLIIAVACRMGRTASSLAMKLVNYASLDPIIRASGRKGLTKISKDDIMLWDKLAADRSGLETESARLYLSLVDQDELPNNERTSIKETQVMRSIAARLGQQFFRESVLKAYNTECCISSIGLPELLRASHILPWSDYPEQRLDIRNGLCLSAIHDAAFDRGLISFDDHNRMLLSSHIRKAFPHRTLEECFFRFEGEAIRAVPKLFQPNPSYLKQHRETIFRA